MGQSMTTSTAYNTVTIMYHIVTTYSYVNSRLILFRHGTTQVKGKSSKVAVYAPGLASEAAALAAPRVAMDPLRGMHSSAAVAVPPPGVIFGGLGTSSVGSTMSGSVKSGDGSSGGGGSTLKAAFVGEDSGLDDSTRYRLELPGKGDWEGGDEGGGWGGGGEGALFAGGGGGGGGGGGRRERAVTGTGSEVSEAGEGLWSDVVLSSRRVFWIAVCSDARCFFPASRHRPSLN